MGNAGSGSAGREAWQEIVRLFTSQENQRAFMEMAGAFALTPGGLRALLGLDPAESKQMGTLAHEWHCDPSNVTALVDQLEQRGLAERKVSHTDRRVKTVVLTPAGARARQEAISRLSMPPAGIDSLSDAEQRTLRDLLRKVTAHLEPLGRSGQEGQVTTTESLEPKPLST
jgi:DNA-binding MarR family transcriptional regulator